MYAPRPITTKGIRLPAALQKLVERLARNNHELWSRQRIAEGWRYGPVRDQKLRTQPDLVPYAKLSESEKEYDRIMFLEAIRALRSLGWRILPPTERTPAARGPRRGVGGRRRRAGGA